MQWVPSEKKAVDKDQALKLALEALQWNWGGEPLPTLELQAINAIKEALAQSDKEFLKKFTELIVRECIQVVGLEDSDTEEWFKAKADSVNKIKEHFGVENEY